MKRLLFALVALLACLAPSQAVAQQPQGATPNLAVMFEPKLQAVVSAEVSSRVVLVAKEMGEPFKKGDVLFRLDDESFVQNLKKTQAAARAAAANYKTTVRLREDKSASVNDLEYASRDLATAEANAVLARKDLVACTLAAPFPGRVKRVLVREHEWVERGKPLVEIVDDAVLLAKILLPSWSIGRIPVGMDMQIMVNETGEAVTGKVFRVGEVIDAASATYEVQVEVDNSHRTLRAGMTGVLKNLREKI